MKKAMVHKLAGAEAVKQRFGITFVSCDNVNPRASAAADDEAAAPQVLVAWKRGTKKDNKGCTTAKQSKGGVVEWGETVTVLCTLMKAHHHGSAGAIAYDPKLVIFSVKEIKKKKKSSLGKVTVNLSDYADLAGSTTTKSLLIKRKGTKTVMTLVVKFSSENLGQAAPDEMTEVLQSKSDGGDSDDDDKVNLETYEEDEIAKNAASGGVAVGTAVSTVPAADEKKSKEDQSSSSPTKNERRASGASEGADVGPEGKNKLDKKEKKEKKGKEKKVKKEKEKKKEEKKGKKEKGSKKSKEDTSAELAELQKQLQEASTERNSLKEANAKLTITMKEEMDEITKDREELERRSQQLQINVRPVISINLFSYHTPISVVLARLCLVSLNKQKLHPSWLKTSTNAAQLETKEKQLKELSASGAQQSSLKALQQKLSDSEEQLHTFETENAKLKAKEKAIDKEREAHNSRVRELESENFKLREREKDLEWQLQQCTTQQEAKKTKKKDKKKSVKEAELEHQIEQEREREKERDRERDKEREKEREKMQAAESESAELKIKVAELSAALAEEEKDKQKQKQKKIEEEKLKEAEKEKEKEKDPPKGKGEGSEKLAEEMKSMSEELGELRECVQVLHGEKNDLKKRLKDADAALAAAGSSSGAADLVKENQRMREERQQREEELQADIQRLSERERDMQQRLAEAEQRNAKLASAAATATAVAAVQEVGRPSTNLATQKRKKHDESSGSEDEDARSTSSSSSWAQQAEAEAELQRLRHEAEVSDIVLKAFYQADPQQADAASPSSSVKMVMDAARSWDCLGDSPDPCFFAKVIEALQTLAKVYSDSTRMSSYWLTSVFHLVQGVYKQTVKFNHQPNFPALPEDACSYVLDAEDTAAQSRAEPPSTAAQFASALRRCLRRLYAATVRSVTAALAPVTVQAVFGSESRILFGGSPAPVQASSVVKPQSGRKRGTMPDVIVVLSSAQQSMLDSGVPESLRVQLFCQLMHWLDATIFNTLIDKPELCTCTTGFQLKMSLSALEDFLAHTPELAAARSYLDHTRQAANLLVIDKSVLLDQKSTEDIFPALSVSQLSHLVQSFHPDSVSPKPAGQDVVDQMRRHSDTTGNNGLNVDPTRLIVPGRVAKV
eukprot:TRINITY_DN3390_c0_g1_i10.p1 TRINITY_DN3390_c0_g1~~TRINITY_DN3390_c0_g1_i10.p1  ORF type:complete len:1134 (-),score=372.38 TRINITY_DN3390_c0_g1_i10:522-3923(-)